MAPSLPNTIARATVEVNLPELFVASDLPPFHHCSRWRKYMVHGLRERLEDRRGVDIAPALETGKLNYLEYNNLDSHRC
jgi:hypothetical protein